MGVSLLVPECTVCVCVWVIPNQSTSKTVKQHLKCGVITHSAKETRQQKEEWWWDYRWQECERGWGWTKFEKYWGKDFCYHPISSKYFSSSSLQPFLKNLIPPLYKAFHQFSFLLMSAGSSSPAVVVVLYIWI